MRGNRCFNARYPSHVTLSWSASLTRLPPFPIISKHFGEMLRIPKHFRNEPKMLLSLEIGAWLSLVERTVRDREVGGSNPLAPTSNLHCTK